MFALQNNLVMKCTEKLVNKQYGKMERCQRYLAHTWQFLERRGAESLLKVGFTAQLNLFKMFAA